MGSFTTYCDLAFLDQFYRQKPDEDVASQEEEVELWRSVNKFLGRHSDVVVAASDADLKALINRYPYLRQIIDKVEGTTCTFDVDALNDVEEVSFHEGKVSPWRLFFINDTTTPHEELSALYGALFLSADDVVSTWKRIGGESRELIVAETVRFGTCLRTWADVKQFRAPLTALVVCDRYMLKHRSRLEENIGSLLVNLLPEGPNRVSIDIMLIAEDAAGPDLPRIRERLQQQIKAHRPQLKFSMTIVNASKSVPETHDRWVIMNYGVLWSLQSFNYFKRGKIDTSTTLEFRPIFKRDKFHPTLDKLCDFAALVARLPEKVGLYPNVVGSKENTLLRAAKELEEARDSSQPALTK